MTAGPPVTASAAPAGPDAICLMGPTCTGKTALALALARQFQVEIVSVDSAVVYRGMDIGTSKPSPAERDAVPHHLIDICDPGEVYSAGRFRRDAIAAIAGIRARGRVPLLVGGSMLYFRALTHGLAPLPEADPAVRASIDGRARTLGWPALHAELMRLDPAAGARIGVEDAQRIQRALEVHALTGRRLSELQQRAEPADLSLARFALLPCSRATLYARIDLRFKEMLEAGLLDEVRRLQARGDLHAALPSVRAVGYRQLWAHLAGEVEFETAVAAAQQATRHLAKRQLTWLRADPGIHWLTGIESAERVPISDALTGACGKLERSPLC